MVDVPRPSGTVVVIRDGEAGLEVLLLERRGRGEGGPGSGPRPSVFPGGKIDEEDRAPGGEILHSARRASVREAREEAGLELDESALVPISRWITPEISPRRFDTWFFLAAVDEGVEVRVDGREIGHHRWLAPREALAAHDRGEIRLAPPTWVTVTWLAAHGDVMEAVEKLAADDVVTFRPRICRWPGGAVMLYPGDAGYEDGDPEREGARHRLWAARDGYRYERS